MSQITEKGATGALSLTANGSFQSSTDANLATLVGTRYDLSDGREVILVSTPATAINTAGLLCQTQAITPNHQNCAVSAIQTYSNNGNTPAKITVNLGATAATSGQYAGGFLVVNAGTGKGQTLRIASNPAALSSASLALTLEDAPNVALSTSDSKVCLIPAHGSNVIISPTTPTNVIAGVTLYPLAASSYGFLTSKGITSALSDATVATVGYAISPSVTTAGAFTVATSTGSTLTNTVIGTALQTSVSAEDRTVFINV